MMRQLHINEIKEVTSYGNSCPVVIKADDNATYVLKTRADGTNDGKNDYGIFIETLSYKLLHTFGFKNIPTIEYLIIDDDFIADATARFGNSTNEREQIALRNIRDSKGLNLGVKWIDNSEKYMETDLSKDFKKETINYDGYLMNTDRNKSNPNILYSKNDHKKYLIDFGGAFEMLCTFDDIQSETSLFIIPALYDKFCFDKDYLLFEDIETVSILKNKISKDDLMELIDELPQEWEPYKLKEEIADILSRRVGNKEIFKK